MDDVVRFELYQNPSQAQMGRCSPGHLVKSTYLLVWDCMWIDINLGNAENNVQPSAGSIWWFWSFY